MLCVHPDLICLLIVISQGDRNWLGGTTFGSQNQSGGPILEGGPKFSLKAIGRYRVRTVAVAWLY